MPFVFDVVLALMILGAFAVSLHGLRKVVQEGFLRPWNIVFGVVFGLLLVSYLIYNVVSHKIEPTGWAQIFLTLGLVMVTGLYALVSFRMAEEMRKQRYTESLPLIAPTIAKQWDTQGRAPNEVIYEYLATGIGIKVMWCNVGKGVAINSRFSFWAVPTSPGNAKFFPSYESGTLEVGGKKEVDYHEMEGEQLHDLSDAYRPRLEAEYQDIYERKITTVQEFRIEEQNGDKRVFLGDLYFIINGKRLGEEVARP